MKARLFPLTIIDIANNCFWSDLSSCTNVIRWSPKPIPTAHLFEKRELLPQHSRRITFHIICNMKYKCKIAGIKCFNGHERGTSSHCPECSNKQKPKGRDWNCQKCSFLGHRDIVGSLNMFPIAFDERVEYPTNITYLRSSTIERSSSSLDTGQSCLDDCIHVKKPLQKGVALATS